MSLKTFIPASVLALALVSIAAPHAARADMNDMMKMLDPDSDGTLSLDEAHDAAAKKFGQLDPDSDSTIDMKEAKGMMKKGAFKKGDPDHDGTIDKTEYMSLVDAAFKKADKDSDGTLDAKELKSKAGKKLLKMLK